MSDENMNNPYESFRRLSEMWEKGLNDLLIQSIDNRELIRMTQLGVGVHSRYVERLKRNQELMANIMNIPTKNDVANVAKLTIQAEEKVDTLQQQIWSLQDSFALANQEQHKLLAEIMEFTKQLHTEWVHSAKDLAEAKKLTTEMKKMRQELVEAKDLQESLLELKQELIHFSDMKNEVNVLRELLKKEKEETALAVAGTVE